MIRNDREYNEAVDRIQQEKQRFARQRAELEGMGLSHQEIARALNPVHSFHEQLVEEVAAYERLRRGEFEELSNLRGVGQLLVSLRIARGISQRQLAQRLGVHESQVSRDERNEYHGVTLERATRVLESLGAELHSYVELLEPSEAQVG